MMRNGGFLHRLFLKKEKKLYELSDTIGCMSRANRNFVIKYNPEVNPDKVEINPNSIEPLQISCTDQENVAIRKKYNLPIDKKILVYGGNLGKPQGLDFLLETIENCPIDSAYFLIVGNGTEYDRIKKRFEIRKPHNASLFQGLPKADYDKLLMACDIGLIFLHPDFVIPNFPSRLLSYLEMRKPIIAATDVNTDIGDVIEQGKCGYKVISGNQEEMFKAIDLLVNQSDLEEYGNKAWELLLKEYLVDRSYELIKEKTALSNR